MVKKEFSKQAPTLPTSQPQYAGMATWVRALKKRIDSPMKVSMPNYYKCSIPPTGETNVGINVRYNVHSTVEYGRSLLPV